MSPFAELCSALTRTTHPRARREGLVEALDQLARTLAEQRPSVVLEPVGFSNFLCHRLPARPSLVDALADLRAADVFLAWGCVARQPGALRCFEAEVMPSVRRALRGVDRATDFVEEVAHAVRVKLLVAQPARPALINNYLGQGPLASFAMVVAMREAVDRKRRTRFELTLSRAAEAVAAPGSSAASVAARRQLAPHFQEAMNRGFAALTTRQRTLLRMHLLKGLSADQLARAYGVHRATTTRWIAEARATLEAHVMAELRVRLKAGPGSLASLRADLVATVDITLAGLLDAPPD